MVYLPIKFADKKLWLLTINSYFEVYLILIIIYNHLIDEKYV